jgi:hypothetical protein
VRSDRLALRLAAGGQFSLAQTRDAKQVQISYSTLADPKLVSDFTPLMPNRKYSVSSVNMHRA